MYKTGHVYNIFFEIFTKLSKDYQKIYKTNNSL